MTDDSILWRRLDTPGHDACRVEQVDSGWRLDGAAAFLHEGVAAQLAYEVTCDSRWHTRGGTVHGWLGARAVDLVVARTSDGAWMLNAKAVSQVDGCIDLDLGFTPATNLIPLRRVALAVGQSADVLAAWLDVATGALSVLSQRYERRAERTYWYEAPRFDYSAALEINSVGFIRHYPGLWEAEP